MRPHGRAQIDPTRPRATAICQRCGAFVNHDTLRWQFQYGGLKLINLRILVCPECYDEPQIQLRTIILPPDPQPIEFSLPELYPGTDNPYSGIGYSPQTTTNVTISGQTLGANIGTLLGGGGLNAAFDGYVSKGTALSAQSRAAGLTGVNNFIGKAWNTPDSLPGIPASLYSNISYSVSSFTVNAPSDGVITPFFQTGTGRSFDGGAFDGGTFDTTQVMAMGTTLQLQGSNDGINFSVLYSTTYQGLVGETINSISSNLTTGNFQFHRIALGGDGIHTMNVAQVQFNVFTTGQNEE